MRFTEEETRQLRLLCQWVINHPLAMEQQEAQRDGPHLWCADWWTIEICKYLFNTEGVYLQDPPPRRLRQNPLYDREGILRWGRWKLKMLSLARDNHEPADQVVICEVGRGVDLLLASFIKPWAKYVVYDSNPYIIQDIKHHFGEHLEWPVDAICSATDQFPFDLLTKPTLLLANGVQFTEAQRAWLANQVQITAILDGDLLNATSPVG